MGKDEETEVRSQKSEKQQPNIPEPLFLIWCLFFIRRWTFDVHFSV